MPTDITCYFAAAVKMAALSSMRRGRSSPTADDNRLLGEHLHAAMRPRRTQHHRRISGFLPRNTVREVVSVNTS